MNNNIIISNNNKRKKIPLYVFISEEIERRFRRFIALKHQTMEKGLLSLEVEQALSNYLAIQSTQQQNTQSRKSPTLNQIRRLKQVKEDIIKYLLDSNLYLEPPQFIPEKHLDNAIAAVRGIDPRTIRNWKVLLEQNEFIRKSGVNQYEFIS